MGKRVLTLASVILVSACGRNSLPAGTQLAESPEYPILLQPAGSVLVVQTQGGDTLDHTGPANGVYTLPTTGGELRVVGTLPMGWITLAGGTAYYVTHLTGDVYAMKVANGAPQHVARHIVDIANGIAPIDGGLIVIGDVGGASPDSAFRIDLTSGSVSPVTLPANSATSTVLERTTSHGTTLLADNLRGTTLRITARGEISVVAAPPGPIDCLVTTAANVWWFRQSLGDNALPELYSAPLDGGPAVQVPDPRKANEKTVACAANDRGLFYTKGRQLIERSERGESRVITTAHGEFGAIGADDATVYWSEKLPNGKWSIRSLPVH